MNNPKIKAKHIPQGTTEVTSTHEEKNPNSEAALHKKMQSAQIRSRRYTKITDAVADSDICISNEAIPKAKEVFPLESKMHFAKLYYPYAKGGKLFFDQPAYEHEIALCERKMQLNETAYFKEHKIRYAYVKSGEGELEVRARLGDIEAKNVLKSRQKAEHQRVASA